MNADRLLALFDRVAEAPDEIGRLRRFVLDLAVRGKLVPHDPADEPASDLVKRIAAVRRGQVRHTEIRGQSRHLRLDQEARSDLPMGWQSVLFGDIADFSGGRTPARREAGFWNTGDYRWVSIADMEDGQTVHTTKETVSESARSAVFRCDPQPQGTILLSFKLTIGKIARLGIPAYHNEAIISVRPYLTELDPFLFQLLPVLARRADARGAMKGATLNRTSLFNIVVPLPPLAEQRRIVAKVDELIVLCDRLEAARKTRETARRRLTGATYAELLVDDHDKQASRTRARRAVRALPALTARSDQIKSLRRTILHLAVRGKLVPQNPAEQPASEFLARTRYHLEQRARSTRRVRWKPTDPVAPGEFTREMPSGWIPARINDTGLYINGLAFKPSDWKPSGLPIIRIQNLTDPSKGFHFAQGDFPDEVLVRDGDLLVSWSATLEAFVWARGPGVLNQHIFRVIGDDNLTNRDFLLLLLRSAIREMAEGDHAHGLVMTHINRGPFLRHVVAIPPPDEQRRIVARVDQFMALCDQLEAGLEAASTARERLFDSLLHEALPAA